ncbi:MAG TPA: hypothetical protein VKD22_11525 [Ramlibacter sp.]|nr:hypothetical protein [Ramlibacter sp.]
MFRREREPTEDELFAMGRGWMQDMQAAQTQALDRRAEVALAEDKRNWLRSLPPSPSSGMACSVECARRGWTIPVRSRVTGALFGCLAHRNMHVCTRNDCRVVGRMPNGDMTCVFSRAALLGHNRVHTVGYRVVQAENEAADDDREPEYSSQEAVSSDDGEESEEKVAPAEADEPEELVPARPREDIMSEGETAVRVVWRKLWNGPARASALPRVQAACRDHAARALRGRFDVAGKAIVRRVRINGTVVEQRMRSGSLFDRWPAMTELEDIVLREMHPADRFRRRGEAAATAQGVAPRTVPTGADGYMVRGIMRMFRVAVAAGWAPRSSTALTSFAAYVFMALATRGVRLSVRGHTVWGAQAFLLGEGLALAWECGLDEPAFSPLSAASLRAGATLFKHIAASCPESHVHELVVAPMAHGMDYSPRRV